MRGAATRSALWSLSLATGLMGPPPLPAQDAAARFAVLPFENTGSYGQDKEVFQGLELALPALLAGALERHPAADAISSRSMSEVLRKHGLGPSQRFDAATAAQVGATTGARFAVTGSFADFYGKLRVNARLVNARAGEIVKVVSNEDSKLQDRTQVAAIIQAIADRLVKAAGLQPYPPGTDGPAIPADAISAFGRAMLYEERGDRARAAEFYRTALTAHPGFDEAAAGLARVGGG